ncbi:MAG: hypothetical protein H7Z38_22280 [Rubrivivax sp.]|nr:hypothetical protein [Pyrinomonadaceae bacterium]
MQRANGDWFALDDDGRLRMPVFHSSGAAMHARSLHWGMFLFKPMVFDERALKELASEEGGSDLRFWLVDDPFVNLGCGRSLDHTQFDVLLQNGLKQPQ